MESRVYGEMFNFSNMRRMREIVQAWACLDATTEGMKLFPPLGNIAFLFYFIVEFHIPWSGCIGKDV